MRAQKNYQKMLEATIAGLKEQNRVPTLLLHSCCAPCSSYCLEYLSQYFHITVDYYNPNIYPEEEYHMRVQEQQRLIRELPAKYPIAFREGAYDKERFYEMARGMEEEKEGGERCFRCYELRLREAAETAKSLGMDYFTTTLSISPLKNAEKLNEIGDALAEEYGVAYLNSELQKEKWLQALGRAFRTIRNVPAVLLRVRFFQAGARCPDCCKSGGTGNLMR